LIILVTFFFVFRIENKTEHVRNLIACYQVFSALIFIFLQLLSLTLWSTDPYPLYIRKQHNAEMKALKLRNFRST
jgi:hypothetical protein